MGKKEGKVFEQKITEHLTRPLCFFGAFGILYSRNGLLKTKAVLDAYVAERVKLYERQHGVSYLEEQIAILRREAAQLRVLPNEAKKKFVSTIKANNDGWEVQCFDAFLCNQQRHNKLNMYAVNPFFIGQIPTYSAVLGRMVHYDDITYLGCHRRL